MALKGASLVGIDTAGGIIGQPPVPQTWYKVDGSPVALHGAIVAPHGSAPHAAATMVATTTLFKVGGIPIVREDDLATCGDTASGSAWYKTE